MDLTILYQVCKFIQGSVLLQKILTASWRVWTSTTFFIFVASWPSIIRKLVKSTFITFITLQWLLPAGYQFPLSASKRTKYWTRQATAMYFKRTSSYIVNIIEYFPLIHSLLSKTYIKKAEMPKVPTKEPDSASLSLGSQWINFALIFLFYCPGIYMEFWLLCNFYLQCCVAARSNKFSLKDTVQIM